MEIAPEPKIEPPLLARRITDDGIGVLTLDRPPLNSLGPRLIGALMAELEVLATHEGLRALILMGAGRSFASSAPPRDGDARAKDAPSLGALCQRLEDFPQPVIAVLHGTVLGGGLELAMAAHYRVAAAQTLVGLPEINLGLPPSAGGTQRLPRLVPWEAALEIMLIGRPIGAREALRLGLIDQVIAAPLVDQAIAYARALISDGKGVRPTRTLPAQAGDFARFEDGIAAQRRRVASARIPALDKIVDCVEAAFLLPFDSGLEFETTAYEDCRTAPEAMALRHLSQAERRAGALPLGGASERVDTVAIAGGMHAAARLAVACLNGDRTVALVAPNEQVLSGVREETANLFGRLAANGRITPEKRGERLERLNAEIGLSGLVKADLVFAPLPDEPRQARSALQPIAKALSPTTPLCILGNDFDLEALARACDSPARIVGLDLNGAAHVTRFAEIRTLADTDPGAKAALMGLLRDLGKIVVVQNGGRRSISDQIIAAALHAADFMLIEGATPYLIDKALVNYGFAHGLYHMIDRAGLTRSGAGGGVLASYLVTLGRTGMESRHGYYTYSAENGSGVADEEVLLVLEELRQEYDIAPRDFAEDEVVQRCLVAMANAGAELVRRGAVASGSDIDLAAVYGLGFPRWRGGPMLNADQLGLLRVRKTLDALMEEDPEFWAPSPLFEQLIKNGQRLAECAAPHR